MLSTMQGAIKTEITGFDFPGILYSMEIPFFIISYPELRFVFMNRANYREIIIPLSGGQAGEGGALQKSLDEIFINSVSAADLRSIITRSGRENKTMRLDKLKLTDTEGRTKYFNVVCSPLIDQERGSGHIVGAALQAGPAGEGRAEQELDRTRMTLRAVLDSTLSVVFITDSRYKVMACSKAALRIWEMTEGDVIGKPIEKILSHLTFQGSEIPINSPKEIKLSQKVNAGITSRSGESRSLLLGFDPLLDSRGNAMGLIMVGADISSLIEKQEKIIENERLALIGQLTSGIAHEIKNPLTVISGFAEVTKGKLAKIEDNEAIKGAIFHYQQEIIDNCRSMNRLIIDLLQLARPKKTEKIKTNLAELLEKICNTVEPYTMQNNVTLSKSLGAANRDIWVDPAQMGQVMLNLCNNAVQAMPRGGDLAVEVRLEGSCLVIVVSDTGTGISPEDLNRLGTPFFSTKAEGTGLGLSVTYSIIRDHGGRIEVESEVGKGTTFNIYLPLDKAASD